MNLRHFVCVILLALSLDFGLHAQTNEGDIMVIYGANYSSGDRKDTIFPGWVGPLSIAYRLWCPLSLGVDDDTFVVNNANAPKKSGTGDLGFEGHFTVWTGHSNSVNGMDCPAKNNWALTVDYIATVPVSGTLENTELMNQFKVTYNRPLTNGNFYVNAGLVSSGISSGGTTQNALMSANYLRNLNKSGTWGVEGEVDLQSASKLNPSSASLLVAFDATLGKSQLWTVRFGTSGGLTPYAPKVSPFIQLIYSGSLKRKQNRKPTSVLLE